MKINYASLTIDSLAELVKRVLNISKKTAYVMVLNHPLLQKLMEVADEYLLVFDKKTFSGMGSLVAKADLLRDNLFKGMKNSVLGMSQMHGLAAQQDAIDLYAIFETHGLDLYHYSYDAQSSHLDKLIEDLEIPANKAKIERLHLTEAYELMKTSQQNFELNFGEQSLANSQLRTLQSASSLQNKMIEALRNYLHFIDVMTSIDASWIPLSKEIDERVKAALNSKQNPPKPDAAPEAK